LPLPDVLPLFEVLLPLLEEKTMPELPPLPEPPPELDALPPSYAPGANVAPPHAHIPVVTTTTVHSFERIGRPPSNCRSNPRRSASSHVPVVRDSRGGLYRRLDGRRLYADGRRYTRLLGLFTGT
jgi:hypothetical protein